MNTQRNPHPDLPIVPELAPSIHVLILTVTTLIVLLCGSLELPLIDRDEPRFAQATREMMHRHDWMVPYFNGDYRFDKPPFIYWNMMASYGILGYHEIAARLPAILHTLLLVLVTYQIGRTFFNATTGFCAAFALATCLQTLIHGRLAVADLPMIFDLTVAQGLLMTILLPAEEGKRPWINLGVFYLAEALGFLAKGPVVQAVTLLTLLILRYGLWRHPLPWHRLKLQWGLPFLIGLIGLWGIPALITTHGQWWQVGIGQHVVARGMESFNGRSYFAPYYLITSLFSLFPWLALIGYGWLAVRQNWDIINAFLCSWVAATYLLFTVYSTQLPHYVMPAFPAFFLLLGQMVTLHPVQSAWPKYLLTGIMVLYGLLLAALCVLGFFAGMMDNDLIPLLLGLLCIFLGLFTLLHSFCSGAWRIILLDLVILSVGWELVGHELRTMAPSIPIGEIAQRLPPEAPCVARGYSEPSLVFYSDRHWSLDRSLPAIQQALQQPGAGLVVELVEERSIGQGVVWLIKKLQDSATPSLRGNNYTHELAQLAADGWETREITGLNLARSSWVRLKVYYRLKNP